MTKGIKMFLFFSNSFEQQHLEVISVQSFSYPQTDLDSIFKVQKIFDSVFWHQKIKRWHGLSQIMADDQWAGYDIWLYLVREQSSVLK